MKPDGWTALGTWALFGATLLGAVLVIVTLNSSRRETKRANSRIKKQATVNFYADTLERRINWQSDFPHPRQSEAIALMLNRLKQQPLSQENILLKNKIHSYLAFWELTAVALSHNVFDRDLFQDLLKGHFLAVEENYRPFIEDARLELKDKDNKLYAEIQDLARAWGNPE
jgi:hypothetical protein